MRLTAELCRYWRIPGRVHYGKNRAPEKITAKERKSFFLSLKAECVNEMWLTRPYLNEQQQSFLENSFRQKTRGSRLIALNAKDEYEFKNRRYRINMKPHVKFEDRWAHLLEQKKWSSSSLDTPRRVYEKFAHAAVPTNLPDQWPKPDDRSLNRRILPDNTLTTAKKLEQGNKLPSKT